MNPLLKPLMISCKKASELTDKGSVVRLKPLERMRLNYHTKMCAVCKSYEKHSLLLDKAIERMVDVNHRPQLSLSTERREKILEAIKG